MKDFARKILQEIEKLIDMESIQTLVFRSDSGAILEPENAIKLVHMPTGIEVICDDYESQTMNKALALIRLAQKLKDRGVN